MKESQLTNLLELLQEMIYQFDIIIKGFKERNNVRVAGITCDILPSEIIASFGLIPLRIPSFLSGRCFLNSISDLDKIADVYDCLILPDGCINKDNALKLSMPVYEFRNPTGYGEEHALLLHEAIDDLLKRAEISEIEKLDTGRLKFITEEYNSVRRLVRGIASVRKEKPDILSAGDLYVIFEAASLFPPSITVEYLSDILEHLNKSKSSYSHDRVTALVYSSFIDNGPLLDNIEKAGCLIAEDDSCNGRRQFDLSFNDTSKNLYYEILDAYSYKPLCPSIRPVEERFELFYKMLKNHGIELVIFIEDLCCKNRKRDIDYLRIRLMRSGVDPIVFDSVNAVEKIEDYISNA